MAEMDKRALGAALENLDGGAADALLWIDELRRSAASVAQQADSLVDAGRMARLSARRLGRAAARNNCIGVFGPSQAGKSYLVSALARPKQGRLTIRMGDGHRDFLQEINPPGDRESTGLVTRFTTRPGPNDPAFPIAVRLLTETDIVKVLANSFFLDFDPNSMTIPPVEEEDVRAAVAEAADAARSEGAAHLDEIALYDLGLYFRNNFRSRIGAFDRAGYWRALIDYGGHLPRAERAKLFSLLWGRTPEFTSLYNHLVAALDGISHATDAQVAEQGMIPREIGAQPNSIIDVAVLKRMRSPEDEADRIPLRTADGQTDLPRATLTALIAEVSLTIEEAPWPFFEHADLLDFPGARSRLKLRDMPADPAASEAQLRELFLRGKIAYLFQRNTDELELTSMLLCMPPSVAEVKDLSGMVQSWINATHGATPERRRAVRNALFLILTKHDLEFQEKGGETDDSRRGKWDRRLHASLTELYGKDGWPADWDGKPFANTFFLRNPGMKQVHLMRYADEDALIESEAVDNAAFRAYRAGFMESAETAKHFTDREAVWAAAMTPNDGGVEYLVETINRVLDPDLKRRQASEQLVEAASALAAPLAGFHHAEGDDALREADERMIALRKSLNAAFGPAVYRNFAHFQRALMIDEPTARGVFLNVAAMKDGPETGTGPDQDAASGAFAEADPWADDEPVLPTSRPKERPEVYADNLLNAWAGKMRELQRSETALAALNLPGDAAGAVVDELLVGAARADLAADIAAVVRAETKAASVRWQDAADRVAAQAAGRINDYVAYLGFGDVPATERPAMPEAPKPPQRSVFAQDLVPPGLAIGEARAPMARDMFLDWGVALRAFGRDNVGHAAGREISDEQNARLGEILRRIRIG